MRFPRLPAATPTTPKSARVTASSNAVLEHGPISAAELGDLLGFTPPRSAATSTTSSRSGVIEVKRVARAGAGAGRPARRYVLSSQGQSTLGNDYLDIATLALRSLGEAAGREAVRQFAVERFAEMERRYAPRSSRPDRTSLPVPGLSPRRSAATVSSPLPQSIEAKAPLPAALSSVQLCQGHCPIQHLAAQFPVFCDVETEVFSRLVGVDVRRLSTLARGGHVCTTHIPTGRPAAGGTSSPQQPRAARTKYPTICKKGRDDGPTIREEGC